MITMMVAMTIKWNEGRQKGSDDVMGKVEVLLQEESWKFRSGRVGYVGD